MTDFEGNPYGWAPLYRSLGYETRPCIGKECKEKKWQLPDSMQTPGIVEKWDKTRVGYNIALRTSTSFPDGTLFGALDIDHPDPRYVELAREMLQNPVSGRVGKKGAVFFFRYLPLRGRPCIKYVANEQLVADVILIFQAAEYAFDFIAMLVDFLPDRERWVYTCYSGDISWP